jgi:predicted glycoside hydrolase/deacetylase ChbG (UPF0249 family)
VDIVINADDFGISDDTVDATIECFERGVLASASIMACAPASERALAYARSRPDLSFGVHLVFVGDGDEVPLLEPSSVPGLVDRDGRLASTNVMRLRALLEQVPVPDIELEAAAQIDAVVGAGVPVSHVDSHRHLHKFRPFRDALARVLPRFGITRVRTAQDVYLRRPVTSPTYWLGRRWSRALARAFETTDHFYMPTSAGDVDWHEPLLALLAGLEGATLEVGVHPGTAEDWRRAELSSVVKLAEEAGARGHAVVGWKDVVPVSETASLSLR